MTNKEAIKALRLEGGLEISGNARRLSEFMEALDVAISALHNQPTGEKCDYNATEIRPGCNAPLMPEQLRGMDGKPVWVDFTGSAVKREPGWFILKNAKECEVYLVGKVSVYKAYEYYGKAWTAYAYPPAQIDREAWEPCYACKPQFEMMGNNYCGNCGRPLTEEAWDELEKRLRGE